jgi:hypothetical protein
MPAASRSVKTASCATFFIVDLPASWTSAGDPFPGRIELAIDPLNQVINGFRILVS